MVPILSVWKQLGSHLSSVRLRELCTHLFNLYWLWNSLSFAALYSFWYLRSCSLIFETSVENASGKPSACCRWSCCCCICSAKRLAFWSSWTSDSCVLGFMKTEIHIMRSGSCGGSSEEGKEHVHTAFHSFHSWVEFGSVTHLCQVLH